MFLILPLFALANAGVSLEGLAPKSVLEPVALGSKPSHASWIQVIGVASIAGIGFTMSWLLASLAFEPEAPVYFANAKLGVLVGSTISALAGIAASLLARPRPSTA